jgi:hypothetical protein
MAYYRYTSPSPIDGFFYSASLSLHTNPLPHRYQYPVYPSTGEHQSSLIQVLGFSERPFIVPPEVLTLCLNVGTRALSPKRKPLINLSLGSQDQRAPFSSSSSRQ